MSTALQLVGIWAKVARAVGWLLTLTRPLEAPIFDVEWRFYDEEPRDDNAVGRALFKRAWAGRRVVARWVRIRERSVPKDTLRYYTATGRDAERYLVSIFGPDCQAPPEAWPAEVRYVLRRGGSSAGVVTPDDRSRMPRAPCPSPPWPCDDGRRGAALPSLPRDPRLDGGGGVAPACRLRNGIADAHDGPS